MPILPLTHVRDVHHAREGVQQVAEHIRDLPNPLIYRGVQPVHGQSCTICNRTPPSDTLTEICVNIVTNEIVLIGNDVCTGYLCDAIRDLITAETGSGHIHEKARIRRLEGALYAFDR